jgi:hypothetical protein
LIDKYEEGIGMKKYLFAIFGGVMMSVNVGIELYGWLPIWAVLTVISLIDYAKEESE